jgi:hypothetical protein
MPCNSGAVPLAPRGMSVATFSVRYHHPSKRRAAHNVTIPKLKLDAIMSWVAVPKLPDTRARLSVRFFLLLVLGQELIC